MLEDWFRATGGAAEGNQSAAVADTEFAFKKLSDLTGVLHLYDFLVDTYLDAIGNLVLIQDYALHRQYFVAGGMYCRSYADSEFYEQVIRTRKIVSESSVIGCPSKRFSANDWKNFKKYGLTELFELK